MRLIARSQHKPGRCHCFTDMSSEDNKSKSWPGMVDTAYPEPFNQVPPPVAVQKPGQLPRDQIELYFKQGYIVVNEFFTRAELDPCREAVAVMVEQLAQKLFNAGKIKDMYKEYGLFQRLTRLEKEYPGSNILLFKHQKMPKPFRDLWCNERMLNLVEQLIGSDIGGHPSWNMRTKTPFSGAGVIPWHQDSGYMSNDSYDHIIPTAWIPLLDATEENGCMQMVKNGHKSGIVAKHTCCHADTWYITLDEEEMVKTLGVDLEKDVSIEPVPYGGFILFHNLTPHRSGANTSNDIRWSIDLRWQSPSYNWSFYDIQDGILFRSSTDPELKPDWDKFLSVDRKEAWQNKYSKKEYYRVDLEKDVSIEPVPYGGFILFHNLTPHRSGANTSNDIRWSIDLRWQSPSYNWSFYDIQDGILFRSSTDPELKPDWDKFLSVDRKEAWQNKYSKKEITDTDTEFSTIITGPWIGKWEIVNHNKHTEAFKQFLK